MKANGKVKKAVTVANRKSWGRLDEATKSKILKEIETGIVGQREAGRRYGIPRGTIIKWQDKRKLANLIDQDKRPNQKQMTESQQSKVLLAEIQKLKAALEHEKLKNVALETMIEVAEQELHIKIKKKRGTKQS